MVDSKSPKAVTLLSGGLDSATTLYIAREMGFSLYAATFDYSQRHIREIEAAKKIASAAKVIEHRFFRIDLRAFGGSALTDDIDVPKSRTDTEISSGIPITYVPARNTIFLSFALAWAEVIGAHDIFIGVNSLDYSGYPDCRPEFIEAFGKLANLATKEGVEGKAFRIHSPLIKMTKADIIKKGLSLGVDYSLTSSCYDPSSDGKSCGKCDSCILRLKGFKEAGFEDPVEYE